MSKLQLPIGYDDFRKVIENKLTFIDKSLFIKEFFDNTGTEVPIITRPRRFGKTLNLSMLRYFLAAEVDGRSTKGLFDKLKIASIPGNYLQHQGQYPVIFVTLKDIKTLNFDEAISVFRLMIQRLYRGHQYLGDSFQLSVADKNIFEKYISGQTEKSDLELSLFALCELLYKHHGKKVFLLIDEYDTPIQAGYINGFYDEMITFMRGLLGAALKTNAYLARGLVTGVIRIAKESLFSGLNNVKLCSVLQQDFSSYFGFTDDEVMGLLKQTGMEAKASNIREWYNGYQFGNTTIYNPWSIINCITEGLLRPYWVNTSDNAIIRKHILEAPLDFKEQLEKLLQGELIQKRIDEHVIFGDLKDNVTALWSLLVTSGYLKVLEVQDIEKALPLCTLAIPNKEIFTVFQNLIETWLSQGRDSSWYIDFLQSLLAGQIDTFSESLAQIMEQTVSYHDLAKEPEAFYHGLMLGFTAGLDRKQYDIKSNRESGQGRYDIIIIPQDTKKLGIIIELKSLRTPRKYEDDTEEIELPKKELFEALRREAKVALEQIVHKGYKAELTQRGVQKTLAIGIAFYGKLFRTAIDSV